MKRNVLRSIFVAAIAALLVASGSLPSDAVARQVPRPNAFDGHWSVVVYTLQGDCDRALRYSVRIVDGRVEAEDQSYQAAGAVAPNGAIRVTVAEGGRSASGSGRLSGNSGRGSWRTDTGQCTGQWTAERRAAND
jgi:hypothetical protein